MTQPPPDPTARAELVRLLTAAHDATAHLAHDVSARVLYLDAAAAAEHALPGPLGVAVAGVLAVAAEKRRINGLSGILGEPETDLALAVAALAVAAGVES